MSSLRNAMLLGTALALALALGCGGGAGGAKPSTVGDVRVTLDGVAVGKPKMLSATDKPYTDEEEHLIVRLTVTNQGSEPLEYRRWEGGQLSAGTKLEDDQGRRVPIATHSTSKLQNGVPGGRTTIPAGGSISDVLLFRKPADDAKALTLHLQSQKEDGVHEFTIASW